MDSLPVAATVVPARRPDLDLLRIASILGVVAIHVFSGIVANADVTGSGSWWVAMVADIGSIWVVPVFVMVSGALVLAPRAHAEGPAGFYRKRLARIGWAFVFWQVCYDVVIFRWMSGNDLGLAQAAEYVWQGRGPHAHIYFLYLIVGLYALAPVLYAFIAGNDRRARILAVVALTVTTVMYVGAAVLTAHGRQASLQLNAVTQGLPYVGYFVAGWALRDVVLRGGALWATTVGTAGLLAFNIVLFARRAEARDLFSVLPVNYLGPLVMLSAIGVFLLVKGWTADLRPAPGGARALSVLADSVFGVFLVHMALLLAGDRFIPGWQDLRTSVWWAALVTWLACVVLSFLVSLAARRVRYVDRLF